MPIETRKRSGTSPSNAAAKRQLLAVPEDDVICLGVTSQAVTEMASSDASDSLGSSSGAANMAKSTPEAPLKGAMKPPNTTKMPKSARFQIDVIDNPSGFSNGNNGHANGKNLRRKPAFNRYCKGKGKQCFFDWYLV